jgi:dTDP-glucose 4,6-dehydratase
MSQALRGEDVTVFGEGSQTRSICFVSDLVEGIFQLMMSNHVLPMNIGNPEEISMEQLAREIIQLSGSKSRIVHKPLPEDDPKVRQPDISAAKDVLNWQPKVGREEGLRRTMLYFKKKLGL